MLVAAGVTVGGHCGERNCHTGLDFSLDFHVPNLTDLIPLQLHYGERGAASGGALTAVQDCCSPDRLGGKIQDLGYFQTGFGSHQGDGDFEIRNRKGIPTRSPQKVRL